MKNIHTLTIATVMIALSSLANATTIVSFENNLATGHANFSNTITSVGGTVTNFSIVNGGNADFTVTNTDGSVLSNAGVYTGTDGEKLGGNAFDMSPQAGLDNGFSSGLTFLFTAPVNAFGFEVGDWSTCCLPSSIYLSFDSGPKILLATAINFNSNQTSTFVSAINDTGTFSKVNVWGDGYGEYLVAGGLVSYGAVGKGTLPTIPEPATLALMGLGLAGMAQFRRRKTMI